jgi:Uma2 family endonuclease
MFKKGGWVMSTDLKRVKPDRPRRKGNPEPTWEIARLFPSQGDWSEEEYFALESNHLIEYSDGFLEFLPMPTIFHQLILQFLYKQLDSFVAANNLGTVVLTGYKVRLRTRKYREPDILFIKAANRSRIKKQYCERVDLAIEVVSEKNRAHDVDTKRLEYARAGIPEYWIVDAEKGTITVLVLKARERRYAVHGVFRKGEEASSKGLPGFVINVTTALSQRP